MRKIIKVSIVIAVFLYLIGAWVELNFNFLAWSEDARFVAGMMWFCVNGAVAVIQYLENGLK